MLAGAGKIKRVCRATLQCEAYSLQHAAEHGDRIRTALLEMQGKLPMSPHWEEVGAVLCLSDRLTDQVPRQVEDKRLSIELAGLRVRKRRRSLQPEFSID